jgi:hypothetical protein
MRHWVEGQLSLRGGHIVAQRGAEIFQADVTIHRPELPLALQ